MLVDPLTRLAGRASTKVPACLLPSLREAADQGRPHELLALAVAAWLHTLRAPGGLGLADVRADELRALALEGGEGPRPVLAVPTCSVISVTGRWSAARCAGSWRPSQRGVAGGGRDEPGRDGVVSPLLP